MIGLFCFALAVLGSPFKSKLRLEAENAVLRHQLIVLKRRLHGRVRLTDQDRGFLIQLYRWFASILAGTCNRPARDAGAVAQGRLRRYWRWKSRRVGGRPQIEAELCVLIRQMSLENPLWARRAFKGSYSSSALRSRIECRQIHGQAARAAQPGMARFLV